MAFDQPTRNRLARFVGEARAVLTEEFTRQLQHEYGLDPARGEVAEVAKLTQLDDARRETARILRETLAHYLAGQPTPTAKARQEALDRIVREQAFTVLNRLCALRMAEARGIVIESIAQGYQSRGFQLYARLAGTALGETGEAYRAYLFSLFDEFAVDLAVLFDRFSPQGRLFPRASTLLQLLAAINHADLEPLWAEDETIGWIYQYFNSKEERKAMRDASQAPRNSRELAVRNQFFTPRYVVEFLTDNTLGRIWYEMTQGRTSLVDSCRYLVRRPNEIFLAEGEIEPGDRETPDTRQETGDKELSQAELLRQPVYLPFRQIKDPRTILMLDPACGSMHFGLYSFDLYERIYEEAWALEGELGAHTFERPAAMAPLRERYPDKASFLRDVPRLIIEYNIHGIDIDPRAVQIAGLSLWLRAQKSWQAQGLKPHERPTIRKSNIVCAEPMPGDKALLEEFLQGLRDDRLEALIRRVLNVPENQRVRATPTMADALCDLVRTVWEEMKLAGEAGSLLKIEEALTDAIAKGRMEWEEKMPLFRVETFRMTEEKPKVNYVKVVPGEGVDFWERAEVLVLAALEEYVWQADDGNSYQRRLFAEDAARGFAFIDLCRKRYDIVLMNPPFGALAAVTRELIAKKYSRTKNDLYAAFVERGLEWLHCRGRLGAITSRTGFFLSTFQQWREEILLKECQLSTLVDLGAGVLDSAVVEVACYVLEKSIAPDNIAVIFRLLSAENKSHLLKSAILEEASSLTFGVKTTTFGHIKSSPFAYWIPEYIRKKFEAYPTLEPTGGDVRCGLSTNDNPRFVRAIWEVSPENHFFCYYPIGENRHYCSFDDPVVRSFLSRRSQGRRIWCAHVMAGTSQPWFSPMTVVVNWENEGREIKAYARFLGNSPSRNVRSENYYFRPGISWTRRAVRLIPYVIPSNSIPTASRYMAFPKDGLEALVLGCVASNFASVYMRMFGEWFTRPNFLVDKLKSLPWSRKLENIRDEIECAVKHEILVRRKVYSGHEPYQEFVLPFGLQDWSSSSVMFDYNSLLGDELDLKIAAAYGLSATDLELIASDVREAVNVRSKAEIDKDAAEQEQGDDEDNDVVLDTSERAASESNLSYYLGCVFGRWDIRFATRKKPFPELPDPFSPLPVCPPGMLQNDHGLPATSAEMFPDYPIQITWSGILANAPSHPEDIEQRVREVLRVIWSDRADAIEQEACEILGIYSLRTYFANPNGFFDDHLKRYSKSRRAAPIYWPLATSSGSYTLWLYYHRLTDQTLYSCVNDFVDPKLKQVNDEVNKLRQRANRSRQEEKELDRLSDLALELAAFRDELLRIARFWQPNLNDGVQITAAPLWRLFQHRAWQKRLKETWAALDAGDYDWAHLAYSIWPDRVRAKCKTDKSLAIAHDLEHLYVEPVKPVKAKKGGRKKTQVDDDEQGALL